MSRLSWPLCLTLVLLAGSLCHPVPAAASDVEQFKALGVKPAPGKALVYLYRAGSSLDDYKLRFDGQKIPTLYARSFIVLQVDPGRHRIGALTRGTGGNRGGWGSFELYTFEAGQIYFIENTVDIDQRHATWNQTISEFWKRKEKHWVQVRDNMSFLDYIDTALLGKSHEEVLLAQETPSVVSAATVPEDTDKLIARIPPVSGAANQSPIATAPVPATAAVPVAPVAAAPVSAPAQPVASQPAAVAPAPEALPVVTAVPTAPAVAKRPAVNPQAIAVIIGNRNYAKNSRELPDVDYAFNDAEAIYDYVRNDLGYREGNIIFLKDATQAQLLSTFGIAGDPEGKLFNWVRPKQSDVFVYYSGHGVPGLKDGRSYLLPVDADPATVQMNSYPLDTLYANLASIPARSLTVVIDACFSGGSGNGAVIQKASSISLRTVEASTLPANGNVFTVTGAKEVASWDNEAQMGLFTRAYLDGLKGAADREGFGNGDGQVTAAELKAYLEDEVAYAARRNYGRDQHPQVYGPGERIMATVR